VSQEKILIETTTIALSPKILNTEQNTPIPQTFYFAQIVAPRREGQLDSRITEQQ
jgi:hypothetical protein